jgi:hypothetical protein
MFVRENPDGSRVIVLEPKDAAWAVEWTKSVADGEKVAAPVTAGGKRKGSPKGSADAR